MKFFGVKISTATFLFIAAAVFAVGGGMYVLFSGEEEDAREVAVVRRGMVVQEVNVVGKVKAATKVDLAFERTGRISVIHANTGDIVSQGALLVELNDADLRAQLLEAEANLRVQEARFEELNRGTRIEEIAVSRAKVESARIAFLDAQKNIIDALHDAYSRADDAVRNKLDVIFLYPQTQNPQIDFFLVNSELENEIELNRFLAEGALLAWRKELNSLSATSSLASSVAGAEKNLLLVKDLLDGAALAVNTLQPSGSLSQSELDTWRSNISTARTSVNAAITNLGTMREKLNGSESSLLVAENELFLKLAGATQEQLAAQEAQVEQARAAVENYRVQVSKTMLYAPIDGIITRQDMKVGEIIPAHTQFISIIDEGRFEIEANVPDIDIAKVNIGDGAEIILDAYGNDIRFRAEVVMIDPAETIIEGVPTYKTTLRFVNGDKRIRSGMTANIDILTAQKEDVLLLPARALIRRNGMYTVRVYDAREKEFEEREIIVGIRGSDGSVEIVSGLLEGDRVLR